MTLKLFAKKMLLNKVLCISDNVEHSWWKKNCLTLKLLQLVLTDVWENPPVANTGGYTPLATKAVEIVMAYRKPMGLTIVGSIYIKISCLCVMSVTLCLLRQIISSTYLKIILYVFLCWGFKCKNWELHKYFEIFWQ